MSQWVHIFVILAQFTWFWAPTQQAILLVPVFLETRPKSASLEPVNDFLAYLEQKSWLKNLLFNKNIKNYKKGMICLSGIILATHNSAADWAGELFKPCRLVLQFTIKKKN